MERHRAGHSGLGECQQALLFTPLHPPEKGGFYFNHAIPESVMYFWATRWHGEDIIANTAIARIKRMLKEQGAVLVSHYYVHPESPRAVVQQADVVGSTTQLIKAAHNSSNKEFIVATDNGILHKMRTLCPDKIFLEAATAGRGANCTSCSHCPWMAMNGLLNLAEVLERA